MWKAACPVVRYIVAHDCGRIVNPIIVEGQVRRSRRALRMLRAQEALQPLQPRRQRGLVLLLPLDDLHDDAARILRAQPCRAGRHDITGCLRASRREAQHPGSGARIAPELIPDGACPHDSLVSPREVFGPASRRSALAEPVQLLARTHARPVWMKTGSVVASPVGSTVRDDRRMPPAPTARLTIARSRVPALLHAVGAGRRVRAVVRRERDARVALAGSVTRCRRSRVAPAARARGGHVLNERGVVKSEERLERAVAVAGEHRAPVVGRHCGPQVAPTQRGREDEVAGRGPVGDVQERGPVTGRLRDGVVDARIAGGDDDERRAAARSSSAGVTAELTTVTCAAHASSSRTFRSAAGPPPTTTQRRPRRSS